MFQSHQEKEEFTPEWNWHWVKMVLSREEHAVHSLSSKLKFKAMPGISVQICTKVENRKLPQKIPNQPP